MITCVQLIFSESMVFRVKINTVVTRTNLMEDLSDFIVEARPERWKLLQVLPVEGQNDRLVGEHVVSGR